MEELNPLATVGQATQRSYKEERFEFALYVNNNIICKRNFKINDYISHSMDSVEFKHEVDNIVNLIKDDLASKSRVYTWYFFNPNDINPEDEFNTPLIGPWECTFKFVISDRHHPVMTRIWDGYAYPRSVRERVDIGNKTVKITKDGEQLLFDKEEFFNDESQRLTFEQQVLKAQIMDKPDLLLLITKKICEVCSPSGGEYNTTNDYTLVKDFGDTHYNLNVKSANRKVEKAWEDALKDKTDEYFKNLF